MTTATTLQKALRTPQNADYDKAPQIVDELIRSYWMEIETVQNYLAASTNPVGVRAEEVKHALDTDIAEELGHARRLAKRIHVLGGEVPGSKAFEPAQTSLQPPEDSRDLVTVIDGVIDAETAAIEQYRRIIELCEGEDYVTQDLCIELLADEEEHRRQFRGFRSEFSM